MDKKDPAQPASPEDNTPAGFELRLKETFRAGGVPLTSNAMTYGAVQAHAIKVNEEIDVTSAEKVNILRSRFAERIITALLVKDEQMGVHKTGAMSQRAFEEKFELVKAQIVARVHARSGTDHDRRAGSQELSKRCSVSLITFDFDHFKDINSALGHDNADVLLKEAVTRLKGMLRAEDFIGCTGGDEFRVAVVVPPGNALAVAEKLRVAIAATPFEVVDNMGVKHILTPTISLGVSPYDEDTDAMKKHSDEALLAAKDAENKRPKKYKDRQIRNVVWEYDPAEKEVRPYEHIKAAKQ